ncbi:alpha/beta hydrolase [Spirosoma rigui]|uniref:alpha/beta hydrolase n=1 Tax=Spirosoma rigui TaxID=564064 RepID=UPI0009B1169F|nr:alpha/beta hydrolase-fold protein [Spirosoma rigui]
MPSSLQLELFTSATDDRPVFVTGNFCDWLPDLPAFEMQAVGPGRYVLDFPDDMVLPGTIEYKYTRGGWNHVELDATGEGVPNRSLLVKPDEVEQDYVPHWRWFGMPYNPSFLPIIELYSREFKVPQLDRTRRIHVLLPHDYASHPDKRYPVLYLHDGQNLFGEGAGYGSWQIDQKMAMLAGRQRHEVILVSIDHGDAERIQEYTLHPTRMGRARGAYYLDFIRNTLKPVIDAKFRTLPDAVNTGIGGSSLGGLISIYAGLRHPDVFGRLMVFSPSLWISPKIYFDAIQFQPPGPMKVYVYGGEQESSYMVPNIQRFNSALVRQGHARSLPFDQPNPIDIHFAVDPSGTHQEAHWGREFPKAIEWLFY